MHTTRPNSLAYVALFLGIYIVPMVFVTLLKVHGIAALLTSHGATVVQIGMIMYFLRKRQHNAVITGTIVTTLIVVLNISGAWVSGR